MDKKLPDDQLAKLVREKKIGLVEDQKFDPNAQRSLDLIKKAGEHLREFGENYMGSAVVHYYQIGSDGQGELRLKMQCNMGKLNEVQASFGMQALKRKLMDTFGRKV